MNAADVIAALGIPSDARVDRRVPKSLLGEHGAVTAAGRRAINEGTDEIQWVASLKPSNCAVPAYSDDVRQYLEIAVLQLRMRSGAKSPRLTELTHRAIPYPLLLVSEIGADIELSVAHKRMSLAAAGAMVLDGDVVVTSVDAVTAHADAAARAMALGVERWSSLLALYRRWVDVLVALHVARSTGTFRLAAGADETAARRMALAEIDRLEKEMRGVKAQSQRETQMARRVDLNLELKRLEAARDAAWKQL